MNSTISERLIELMELRNLKQADLVNSIEKYIKDNNLDVRIGKSAISQYVSGKVVPKQDKIFVMASALNVDPVWLLGLEPTKAKNATSYSADHLITDGKSIISVVELMEREDTRTQRFIYELVRDYLNCNEFERGRLNTAANLKAEKTLADKVKTMKKPEDITGEKTNIKEAK